MNILRHFLFENTFSHQNLRVAKGKVLIFLNLIVLPSFETSTYSNPFLWAGNFSEDTNAEV